MLLFSSLHDIILCRNTTGSCKEVTLCKKGYSEAFVACHSGIAVVSAFFHSSLNDEYRLLKQKDSDLLSVYLVWQISLNYRLVEDLKYSVLSE